MLTFTMFNPRFFMGFVPVTAFIMTYSNFDFRSGLSKMNRPKMALAVGVLMVLAGAIRAQTLTDLGATAPTPGAKDIAQFSTSGNTTFPDGLNYYTDNQVAIAPANRARPSPRGPIHRDTH